MQGSVATQIIGALRAAHPGPTLLVVSSSFFVALSVFPVLEALEVAAAILAGQLVVGWSNDVIDFPLDSSAHRTKKPLVSGAISIEILKKAIVIALILTTLLSLVGPLGILGTSLHLLGILSATLYNVRLKSTIFSPIPYIVSFGGLPWAIYLAAGKTPPLWLYLGFMLFTTAFHFLNVLKDLQVDREQGVLGLPQRLGRARSILVALILGSLGAVNLVAAFFA